MEAIPPSEMRMPPRVGPTMYDLQLGRHERHLKILNSFEYLEKISQNNEDIHYDDTWCFKQNDGDFEQQLPDLKANLQDGRSWLQSLAQIQPGNAVPVASPG